MFKLSFGCILMVKCSREVYIKSARLIFDDDLDTDNIVCDYIFVNDKVKVKDLKVINIDISDHLPLLLDFNIKEEFDEKDV